MTFETQIIEYWNEDLEDSDSKYFQALSNLYLTAFANTINEPVKLEADSKISLFQFLSIRVVKFSFVCNQSEQQCIRYVFTSQFENNLELISNDLSHFQRDRHVYKSFTRREAMISAFRSDPTASVRGLCDVK